MQTTFRFSPVRYRAPQSGVTFCRQVAAWFPDMFSNFHLLKNHKIVKNSTNTKAREKISTDLESSDFLKLFGVGLTKLKTIKFYLTILATDFSLQPSYLLGERAS